MTVILGARSAFSRRLQTVKQRLPVPVTKSFWRAVFVIGSGEEEAWMGK
jgi:hypothetical protein